jgi:ribosomal protein L24E
MKGKKCAVCDWEIKHGGKTVKLQGTSVLVCSEDCAEMVKINPVQYLRQGVKR